MQEGGLCRSYFLILDNTKVRAFTSWISDMMRKVLNKATLEVDHNNANWMLFILNLIEHNPGWSLSLEHS